MKILFPALTLFAGWAGNVVHAGGVVSLKDNAETAGKVSLTASAVHIDTGASPIDMPLDSVLEAGFSDRPFSIDYFSSALSPNQLPATWKAQDVGKHPKDGSITYANGVLTLTGTGYDLQRGEKEDQIFIAGQIWHGGGGQLTGRLRDITPNPSSTAGGPMERSSTDSLASMQFMAMRGGDGGGLFVGRGNDGDHVGWTGFPADFPTWFRMSWNGASLDSEVSSDGRKWATVGQNSIKTMDGFWVGLAVNSWAENALGSAVFDQILLTPPAAEPGTFPTGVLLTSGTFLASVVNWLNPNQGSITRAGREFNIDPKLVAVIAAHPLTDHQLASVVPGPGLLFKNGDFMQCDYTNIQGTFFQVNSLVLGASDYQGDTVRAFVSHALKPIASQYEIRLRDGSIIQANGLVAADGKLSVKEVSGIMIPLDPAEIAQFRAGSARVQNLIDLKWKTLGTALAAPVTPAPAPATNAAPVDPTAVPDANSFAAAAAPAVETWQGPNQEQVIVVSAGIQIDFPLVGKFSALSTRIAVSPDSPPGAQAVLHIIIDGKEAGGGPTLKSGDAPQRLSLPFPNPKSIAFRVESTTPGARVILIDPVAIRDVPALAQ